MHPLREARLGAGLSFRKLGAITGIDYRRLHLLENGLRPFDHEIVVLSCVYRTPPDNLREALGLKSTTTAPEDKGAVVVDV